MKERKNAEFSAAVHPEFKSTAVPGTGRLSSPIRIHNSFLEHCLKRFDSGIEIARTPLFALAAPGNFRHQRGTLKTPTDFEIRCIRGFFITRRRARNLYSQESAC